MQLPLEGVPENLLHFYVALDGNRTTGVAGLELADGDAALLRSVAGEAQYRGLGLGTRLVDKAIADAQKHAGMLAQSLGVQLVAIVGYNESSATPQPPIMYADKAMGIGGGGSAPSIPTGSLDVSMNVTLTYKLAQ